MTCGKLRRMIRRIALWHIPAAPQWAKNGKNFVINTYILHAIISKATIHVFEMFFYRSIRKCYEKHLNFAFDSNSWTSLNCTFLWISVHYVLGVFHFAPILEFIIQLDFREEERMGGAKINIWSNIEGGARPYFNHWILHSAVLKAKKSATFSWTWWIMLNGVGSM